MKRMYSESLSSLMTSIIILEASSFLSWRRMKKNHQPTLTLPSIVPEQTAFDVLKAVSAN